MPFLAKRTMKGSTNGSSVTTDPIDTSGCDLIVVSVTSVSPAAAISDSYSNTWIGLTGQNSGNGSVRLFYCIAPTVGAAHTFSCSSGTAPEIGVMAFVAGLSTFDAENGATQSSGTSLAVGSLTTASDEEIVVVATADANSFGVRGIDGTMLCQADADFLVGGQHYTSVTYCGIQHAAGVISPTVTMTNSTFRAAVIAAFTSTNGAGGGGGGGTGGGGISRCRVANA